MMRITALEQLSTTFSDICVKVNDVTETSISLEAKLIVNWPKANSDKEKVGILCQHIKSNKAFTGKFIDV